MRQANPPLDGDWVIDASVALKLFVDDPLSETVHHLFEHLADDPPAHFYVPDFFYIEITNVLWKYVRWQGLAVGDAESYIIALNRLMLHSTPTRNLMVNALSLAVQHQITAYDACYLALAQQLELRILTADAKLARAVADPQYIILLSSTANLG